MNLLSSATNLGYNQRLNVFTNPIIVLIYMNMVQWHNELVLVLQAHIMNLSYLLTRICIHF